MPLLNNWNPQELHQWPFYSHRMTVWNTIAESGIWDLYFFNDGLMVMVTLNVYCHMIKTIFWPKLNQFVEDHDEKSGFNKTKPQLTAFSNKFWESCYLDIFSLQGDIIWPPRTPDLSPCDFFFFGENLKAQVYNHFPTTLPTLKDDTLQTLKCSYSLCKTIYEKKMYWYLWNNSIRKELTDLNEM